MMQMRKLALATVALLVAMAAANKADAGFVYESLNEGQPHAPFFWLPSSIGWYWTPDTDVELEGIQTQLTSGFSNVNNNFTFTTELFTDRPAVGGASLGSFDWNGITFVDGPWLGGSFSSPISLIGGTTYFVGMSGWQNARGWNGPNSGAGVNWVNTTDPSTADWIGLGQSYGDIAIGPIDFETQFNPPPGMTPGVTEFPFLRFIAADLAPPSTVPEPSSLVLLGLGMAAVGAVRRRRGAGDVVTQV
jgi:hypothetical protein